MKTIKETKKIEKEELEALKELQQKSRNVVIELGEVSYGEILLEQRKSSAKLLLVEIQDEEKTLKEFLIQKYGDNLNIDLESGEY